jgi:hypothetical protein
VPAVRRCDREFTSSGSSAHHENLLWALGGSICGLFFFARTGVDHAAHRLELEDMIEAPLIARHAAPDFVGPSFSGLVDEFRVRDQPSGHAHEIHDPLFQNLLCYEGIVNSVAAHHRNFDALADSSCEIHISGLRKIHRNLRNPAFMPATCNVYTVSSGSGHGSGKGSGFLVGMAIGDEVVASHTDQDCHVGPCLLADAVHGLDAEPHSILQRAPVVVFSPVGLGGQELRNEVSGSGDHLNRVEACISSPASGLDEIVLHPLYVTKGHRSGLGSAEAAGVLGRSKHREALQVTEGIGPSHVELNSALGPFFVDYVNKPLQPWNRAVVLDGEHEIHSGSLIVDFGPSDDDESDPPSCSDLVEIDEAIRHFSGGGVVKMHRRHNDPVGQRNGADGDGLK